MHPLAPLAALALLLAAAIAQEPQPFLLGNRLLDGKELKEVATLPPGAIARPQWRADGTAHHAAGLVDPARRLLLAADAKELRLLRIGGDVAWQQPLAEVRLQDPVLLPKAVLGRDIAVIPDHDGHLTGIGLGDGTLRWRSKTNGLTDPVADSELVAALATDQGVRRLRAFALGNGAPAFDQPVPKDANFVTLGPHGIVAGGPGGAIVLARGGPKLFAIAAPVRQALADASGYYLLLDAEVVAFDRNGKERWRRPEAHGHFDCARLAFGTSGYVLVVRFHRMADDGARVVALDPEAGEVVWQRELPPLGVDHSKYWHEVVAYSRGDAVAIASHAAGGQWLAVLGGSDGEVRQRVTFQN